MFVESMILTPQGAKHLGDVAEHSKKSGSLSNIPIVDLKGVGAVTAGAKYGLSV